MKQNINWKIDWVKNKKINTKTTRISMRYQSSLSLMSFSYMIGIKMYPQSSYIPTPLYGLVDPRYFQISGTGVGLN